MPCVTLGPRRVFFISRSCSLKTADFQTGLFFCFPDVHPPSPMYVHSTSRMEQLHSSATGDHITTVWRVLQVRPSSPVLSCTSSLTCHSPHDMVVNQPLTLPSNQSTPTLYTHVLDTAAPHEPLKLWHTQMAFQRCPDTNRLCQTIAMAADWELLRSGASIVVQTHIGYWVHFRAQ